jgi:transcription-repair coupling factor (superfamily II helicase)
MAVKPSFPSLPVERLLKAPHMIASGVPEGLDALLLGELARQTPRGAPILHIARDANRLVTLEDALAFFAPT